MSYKKTKTPYIILIVFFLLLAALDALYIDTVEEQTVMIKVENDGLTEEVKSNDHFFAKYLIFLPKNE